MNQPLYTVEILRLAASLPTVQNLPEPHGVGEKRSKTCGSQVRTEVELDADGRVVRLAQQVHACAFGQASAALVARSAAERSYDEISAAREDFSAWLHGDRDDPGDWPGLSALAPARSKRARYHAMLLPFDALIAAIQAASPQVTDR